MSTITSATLKVASSGTDARASLAITTERVVLVASHASLEAAAATSPRRPKTSEMSRSPAIDNSELLDEAGRS